VVAEHQDLLLPILLTFHQQALLPALKTAWKRNGYLPSWVPSAIKEITTEPRAPNGVGNE
jgi:NADH:ubiquinone oxidoreductase subunit E